MISNLKEILVQWKSLRVFKSSFINSLINQLNSVDILKKQQKTEKKEKKDDKSKEDSVEMIQKNETTKKILKLRLAHKELEDTLERRLKRVYGFKNGIGKIDCRVEKAKLEKMKDKLEDLVAEYFEQLNKLNK